MAGIAIGNSIFTSHKDREYLRRSTRPQMLVSFYYNDEGAGYYFGNLGFGPAYLEWFQVTVDGEQKRSWDEVVQSLEFSGTPDIEFSNPGGTYHPEAYGRVFWVNPGPFSKELQAKRDRIEIYACYCSVFDECWAVANTAFEPMDVEECAPYPPGPFGLDSRGVP